MMTCSAARRAVSPTAVRAGSVHGRGRVAAEERENGLSLQLSLQLPSEYTDSLQLSSEYGTCRTVKSSHRARCDLLGAAAGRILHGRPGRVGRVHCRGRVAAEKREHARAVPAPDLEHVYAWVVQDRRLSL